MLLALKMFNQFKLPKSFLGFYCCVIRYNYRLLETSKPLLLVTKCPSQVRLYSGFQPQLILDKKFPKLMLCRYKSKNKKKKAQHEDDDDDEEDEDEEEEYEDEDHQMSKKTGIEVKTYSLQSLRVDGILKKILGYNRKKVEELFYENNLRLNEKILHKKSANVKTGDVIDAIKGFSAENPTFLKVGRVEILSMKPDADSERLLVKVRKYKSINIENYPDGDPYTSQEQSA